MIYKNVADQKLAVYAYTVADGVSKTGDAANITCYLSKDWGAAAAVTDTNPTELDDTNMKGWYVFDLAQAETNAEVLVFAPVSSTSGVVVDQVQVFTQDAAISSRASETTAQSILTDTAVIGALGAGLSGIPWNAAWDAEVQSKVADALAASIPDSYSAHEALPSINQAVLETRQFLQERAVVGTTATIYKPDGSTPAYTLTLDDATNPTSALRAT